MKEAWSNQKELQKQDIPTYEEMYKLIEAINDPRNKALIALLYLTAGRITEVVQEIRPLDFTQSAVGDIEVLQIRMPNRKNRRRRRKVIPIRYDTEGKYIGLIRNYYNTCHPEKPLFDLNRHRAYEIIKEELGWNPHFIRHVRVTHLVTHFGYGEQHLRMFAGWSDSRQSSRYVELRWQDLVKAF